MFENPNKLIFLLNSDPQIKTLIAIFDALLVIEKNLPNLNSKGQKFVNNYLLFRFIEKN